MNIAVIHFILVVSSAFSLALFVFALTRRKSLLNITFGLFALAASIYAIGYSFELYSIELEKMLFWSRIQYLGIPFISGLLLLFIISYVGKEAQLSHFKIGIIFLIPIITFIARWTNPLHFLFYKAPSIYISPIGALLSFNPGPLYLLHITYLALTLIASTILLIRFILKTYLIYKNQTILIIIAIALQWITLILYLTGFIPADFDINPLMFSITALLFAFAIYRYSLFDVVPVARAAVFDQMDDAIIVVDPDFKLADFNKRSSEMFENINPENIGIKTSALFETTPNIQEMFSLKESAGTLISLGDGYNKLHLKLTFNHLYKRKKRRIGSILTFHDITEQVGYSNELEELASKDALTGIFNRRQLIILSEREVKRAYRTSKPLTLMILDIDHFKDVNDSYGHQGGDIVLKTFCELISGRVREIDIFGRYGGEEFILVMPETEMTKAVEIAERLRTEIEKMIVTFDNVNIQVTVSIGLSESTDNKKTELEELINKADDALYTAKNKGRNQISIN